MPREDDGLGDSAVRRGLITAEQLAEVRRELEERRARGEKVTMSGLLVERRLVDSFTMAVALGSGVRLPNAAPQLARYEIEEMLGHGAMAVVYRAVDRELGRRVAVKVLWQADASSPEMRERFVREARVAAGLAHPNVVAVYDAGEEGGRPYLVMELVEGRSLREILDEGAELSRVIELLEKAARGVGAAHRRGVVHRDLKPANILIAENGEPKVGDFGLAHVIGLQTGLTRAGAAVGTPMYMAPEQVRGAVADITPRTDVYALGAILYQALTGAPPHAAPTIEGVYERILAGDLVRPRRVNPRAPAELERVCLRALEREPESRYEDGAAFADDLRAYLDGRPVAARPPSSVRRMMRAGRRHRGVIVTVAVAAAAVALGVVAAGAMRSAERERGAREEAERTERERRRVEEARVARVEAQLGVMRRLEAVRPELDRAVRTLYDASVKHEDAARRVEEARRRIEEASAGAPELALGPHLLGRAWELLGWPDRAEEHHRAAVRLDAGFGPARAHLSRLLVARAFIAFSGPSQVQRDSNRPEVERLVEEARREADAAREAGSGVDDGLLSAVVGAMEAFSRRDGPVVWRITQEGIAQFKGVEGVEELHLMSAMARERNDGIHRAIAIRPKYALALWCRGNEHMGRQEWDAAIADYDAAIAVNRRFSQAWANRGVSRQGKNDIEGAIEDFSKAIDIDPKSSSPWNNRGIMKRVRKDFAGAVADHTESLRLNPTSTEAWANRGLAYWDAGDLDAAIADSEKAMETAPRDWAGRTRLARDLAAMKKEREKRK